MNVLRLIKYNKLQFLARGLNIEKTIPPEKLMKRLLVALKFFSIEMGQDYFMIFNYKAEPLIKLRSL